VVRHFVGRQVGEPVPPKTVLILQASSIAPKDGIGKLIEIGKFTFFSPPFFPHRTDQQHKSCLCTVTSSQLRTHFVAHSNYSGCATTRFTQISVRNTHELNAQQ
jgi:hypothetical protein